MDLLITLIGNAIVDANFRKRFLDNPIDIVDHYRFRLTKGDFELLQKVFVGLDANKKKQMEDAFLVLENMLYAPLEDVGACSHRPCTWSLCPPPELRPAMLRVA
jgi:hypothetical protein